MTFGIFNVQLSNRIFTPYGVRRVGVIMVTSRIGDLAVQIGSLGEGTQNQWRRQCLEEL